VKQLSKLTLLLFIGSTLTSCRMEKKVIKERFTALENDSFFVEMERYDLNRGSRYVDSFYFMFQGTNFKEYRAYSKTAVHLSDGKDELVSNYSGSQSNIQTQWSNTYVNYGRFFNEFAQGKKFRKLITVEYQDSLIHLKSKAHSDSYKLYFDSLHRVNMICKRVSDDQYYKNDSIVYHFLYPDTVLGREYFLRSGVREYVYKPMSVDSSQITPYASLSALDTMDQISSFTYKVGVPVVVIYSFIGCAPCVVLKNKLKMEAEAGNLDPRRVIVLNSQDARVDIKKYISVNSIPFPYYKNPTRNTVGGFPKVAFYNARGNLVWSQEGYNSLVIRRIKKHLTE